MTETATDPFAAAVDGDEADHPAKNYDDRMIARCNETAMRQRCVYAERHVGLHCGGGEVPLFWGDTDEYAAELVLAARRAG